MKKNLNDYVLKILDEKQAEHIKLYDVREKSPLTDYYIFATANNPRKINAIVDTIRKEFLTHKTFKLHHIEGRAESGWVLIDLYDTVIHVMTEVERERFFLEGNLVHTYKIEAQSIE
jgi:ribosome-associated protein